MGSLWTMRECHVAHTSTEGVSCIVSYYPALAGADASKEADE